MGAVTDNITFGAQDSVFQRNCIENSATKSALRGEPQYSCDWVRFEIVPTLVTQVMHPAVLRARMRRGASSEDQRPDGATWAGAGTGNQASVGGIPGGRGIVAVSPKRDTVTLPVQTSTFSPSLQYFRV